MILAVPLMGSDCYVATRVGGPPPGGNGPPPPPPNGGGGGVIIVTSGDPIPSPPTTDALVVDRQLVASVLAASVWTPPAPGPSVGDKAGGVPRAVVTGWTQIDSQPVVVAAPEGATAVPEPTGLLLFSGGLAVVVHAARTRGLRRDC